MTDRADNQPSTIMERQQRLATEFASLPDWEERYKKIIELGKRLEPLAKAYYDDKFKVQGCQSQVWLHAERRPDGRIHFVGDSDALIVKGLVALLLRVYSDVVPAEILAAQSVTFFKELGLENHLSPSRANGLYAMTRQILYYASVFQALDQR